MSQGNKAENAVTHFKNGYCCSQSVISVFAPELGLERDTALRIASSFCGGMGRRGETCGAVTGAYMALGLKHGTSAPDSAARDRIYELVREFAKRFTERNGSLACKEILGYEIGTPEGYARITEKKLFDTVCTKLVRDAVEIVEELLE
jgi:C_GCAxxG_C_C family probable redox protein